MRAVLDSSAGVASVLPEPLKAKAVRLLNEYRKGLHELHAPDIYPVETLNALAKAERQKRIAGGFALWRSLLADCPHLHPHMPLLARAYAISSQTLNAVYDCVYIALAEQEGCQLVTADDKIVKNLQARFPFIVPLASLP